MLMRRVAGANPIFVARMVTAERPGGRRRRYDPLFAVVSLASPSSMVTRAPGTGCPDPASVTTPMTVCCAASGEVSSPSVAIAMIVECLKQEIVGSPFGSICLRRKYGSFTYWET